MHPPPPPSRGKLLLLGAAGMLGHRLSLHLPPHGWEVVGTVRSLSEPLRQSPCFSRLRLIDGVDAMAEGTLETLLHTESPNVVINAIGIVKQAEAAANRHLSVGINAWLPHRLVALTRKINARLIHISTDCVFSGAKGHYRESDPSDAQDLYGKSKYLGETDQTTPHALTLRTSIIGRELSLPHYGLLEWFLAQSGQSVRGFARAIYSGFTTTELARIIALVLADHPGLGGLYQVASAPISKHDLLELIRDHYDLPIDIHRDEGFQCDRSLDGTAFTTATGYTPPAWSEMIRQMRDDFPPFQPSGSSA